MPKKRTHNFKQLQGPSSPSTKPNAAGKNGESSPSVNERLNELRKAESADAAARKRDIAELVSQRSVPPQLRGILGVPESAPPRARAIVRTPRFRTPGPAPPKSWLDGSRTGWRSTLDLWGGRRIGRQAGKHAAERSKPQKLLRFAEMAGLNKIDENSSGPRSLTHLTLKTVAQQWDMLDEDDFPALAELTLQLRLRLLSYISHYGPAIDIEAFKALTQGTENITHLDLAGLVGHSTLTLPRLARYFRSGPPKHELTAVDFVVDSWDHDDCFEAGLSSSPSISRFSHLTHLSLSHPPSTILWRDLLAFTKQTPHMTHLSLAYWPRPTLTPNLATATVSNQHSPDVIAGGSHFYSDLDQEFGEAASLLRQLSYGLLRLQWLDLEGCTQWIPALAALVSAPTIASEGDDEWATSLPVAVSVFADTWKNLSYINVAQGWMPTYSGVYALPTQQGVSADRSLIGDILRKLPVSEVETHDQLDIERRKASIWLETEIRVLRAAKRINTVRRSSENTPVVMDFGWTQKTK